ncbi:YidH family protein [Vibrio hepatarius]|uniref:YidH family protein n=1 Tax=Vibrio hepatarius TaxID=171383 RepID=UPI00142E6237|nr:DUF202 domain-containing protein [Vibrio hepatarius]NIY83718.1 DUF202 domain-containing protein [Vibrio hepatarius]
MKMGKEPDYRFSLANERTFLAWIRTSLAFLIAALGIDLFETTHVLPRYMTFLGSGFALIAICTGVWALIRWYLNERAMRLDAPFCYSSSLFVLVLSLVILSSIAAFFIL